MAATATTPAPAPSRYPCPCEAHSLARCTRHPFKIYTPHPVYRHVDPTTGLIK